MTKPTKWVCAQRRLRSAWASVQSDQSSLCAQWVAKDPSLLHADSKDSDQTGQLTSCGQQRLWSDWADAQADLTLRWAHSYLVFLSCRGSFKYKSFKAYKWSTYDFSSLYTTLPHHLIKDYKNLSWVWGADRKIRPSGSLFGITRRVMPNSNPEGRIFLSAGHCLASRGFDEWFQTVIPRDGFFYPHRTAMIDSFSCIPFDLQRLILT